MTTIVHHLQKHRVTARLIKKLYTNAATVLVGSGMAALLRVAAVSITASFLGPVNYGVLTLIVSSVLVVDRLVTFQSWQALIQYGSRALECGERDQFSRLITFGFLVDLCTAVFGALVVILGAYFLSGRFGWTAPQVLAIVLYSSTILTHISGSPVAVLRMFDAFDRVSLEAAIRGGLKLIAAVVAFYFKMNLWGFLLSAGAADVVGNSILVCLAYGVFRKRGHRITSPLPFRRVASEHPGILRFLGLSNVNTSLRMAIGEADVLIVGVILGAAGVGIFKVAKTIASMLLKITAPLYQAIYPDVSSLVARDDLRELRRFMLMASLCSGAVGIAVWVGLFLLKDFVVRMLFGAAFLAAAPALILMAVGFVIYMFAYPLSAAVLAFGKPQITLAVQSAASAVFFPIMWLLTREIGIQGAAMSTVVFYALSSGMMFFGVKSLILKRQIDLVSIEPASQLASEE